MQACAARWPELFHVLIHPPHLLGQESRLACSRCFVCSVQILERIGEEIDPEGVGLTFSDFENLATRMPDLSAPSGSACEA